VATVSRSARVCAGYEKFTTLREPASRSGEIDLTAGYRAHAESDGVRCGKGAEFSR
jgi:hypothetical protein